MKTFHWLLAIGLMIGCVAPDMNNPQRRQQPPDQPVEEILKPVADILKFILLGETPRQQKPWEENPEREFPNQNPQGDKKKADQAKAEAAKALNEAKKDLEVAAAAAANAQTPEQQLANAAQSLEQAAEKLTEVAGQAAQTAKKAQVPQEKQAAQTAKKGAERAAQQAKNLARLAKGKLPTDLSEQIAQSAQEMAERNVPELKRKTAEVKANADEALEAAQQALEAARQAALTAGGDKQKLAAAVRPLEQAAEQFSKVANQAAKAAQTVQTPMEKQVAEAAQRDAEQAAQQARNMARMANGQLPLDLPKQIAKATRKLAGQDLPGIEQQANEAKADVGNALEAAKKALAKAGDQATAAANGNRQGNLLADAAKPLEQAAGRLDSAAQQAAQAARNAQTRRDKRAADAANRQAQATAQQARNMARHARGELPEDLARQIAEVAKEMAGRGVSFIEQLAKEAKVDATKPLGVAKTTFENAAKMAAGTAVDNDKKLSEAAVPLIEAANQLSHVAQQAAEAAQKAQTPAEKKAAEVLRQAAEKAAQQARNMAQQTKGELPEGLAGQIAKAAREMAEQDVPGIGQVLNGQVIPDKQGNGKGGKKFAFFDNPFFLRKDPKARQNIINRLGGSEETEDAVRRALEWFTRVQEPDGSWQGVRGRRDSAATGLAMLAYMGYGAKHTWSLDREKELALAIEQLSKAPVNPGLVGSRPPADRKGEINKPVDNAELTHYQKPLAKAVEWMLRVERNGDLRGRGGDMYDHGIAAIALAEAYSLTKDPRLRKPVERVVAFTIKAQNPKTGGWRYLPYKENPLDRGDMSVTGWQLMSLKSAQRGGIDVPEQVFDRVRTFLNLVSMGNRGGDYRYLPGGGSEPAMTAEGMFCQQLLGPDRIKLARAIKLMEQAAEKFAKVAQQAADGAETTQTPERKKAAEAAKRDSEKAVQKVRSVIQQTKGKLPLDLPVQITEAAQALVGQDVPAIKKKAEVARIDVSEMLEQAEKMLDQAEQTAEFAVMDSFHPRMRESSRLIQAELPTRTTTNYYYWYYGSLAMHQNQGQPWEQWNERVQPILLGNQVRNNGRNDGSWDPVGQYGPQAGRPVITALATLSLEVYYRYLPLNSLDWMKKAK